METTPTKSTARGLPVPHLRQMRLGQFLTQEELASLAGTAHTHISRLENGAHCGVATLRRLADALGVRPEQLVD